MSWPITLSLIVCLFSTNIRAATHDEISQCGLTGVYKTRQSILESPNYPDHYPANTCWDYVVRSPYRCPTKFHVQFLDFFLESSLNCSNDYLAVGLENDGDDMDLLCGQVIGIKKYHTPDGVLRLRFFADASPWTTGRGFKLLVTRLACEREDLLRANINGHDDEDSVQVNAPPNNLQLPQNTLPEIFRNISLQDQHVPYPVRPLFGWNLPNQLPNQLPHQFPNQLPNQLPPFVAPPHSGLGGFYLPIHHYPAHPSVHLDQQPSQEKEKPCPPTKSEKSPVQPAHPPKESEFYLPNQGLIINQQLPAIADQYPTTAWKPQPVVKANEVPNQLQFGNQLVPPQVETCCVSSFRQKRFYLSSPGFPRTVFSALLPTQQRDCQFQLEKSSHNICRLRIEFKFFDFGQSHSGTGARQGNINVAIANSREICTEDYLEIDGERFCGCRSGYVYTTLWGLGPKSIRMRMGYSGLPANGFLLEIFQEECRSTVFVKPELAGQNGQTLHGQNNGLTGFGNQPGFPQTGFSNIGNLPGNIPNNGFTSFGDQQFNGLPGSFPQNFGSAQQLNGQNNGFTGFGNQQSNNGLAGFGNQQSTNGLAGFGNQQSNNGLAGFGIQQSNNGLAAFGNQQSNNGLAGFDGQQNIYPVQQTIFGQQQQQQQPPFYQPGSNPIQSNGFVQPTFPHHYQNNVPYWNGPIQSSSLLPQNGPFPQFRNSRNLEYARSESSHQPVSVVETNSTRKEIYYHDGDEAFARSRTLDEPDEPDDDTKRINSKLFSAEKNRCSFDTTDVLKLSVDVLWLTKPTCYSPQRSWFSNIFG